MISNSMAKQDEAAAGAEMRHKRHQSPTDTDTTSFYSGVQEAAINIKSSQSKSTSRKRIKGMQGTDVRLMTFNLHGWRDTVHKDNLAGIISAVEAVQPDVLVLQEVLHPYLPPTDPKDAEDYFARVKSGKGNGFEPSYMTDSVELPYLDRLAAAAGLPHMTFGKAIDDGYFGKFGYGNAILSRFPIVSELTHVIKANEQHKGESRRIEAEDRNFTAVTVQINTSETKTFCVTHLDQLSDDLRCLQVEEILSLAKNLGPHIFAGDFNVFQKSDCSQEHWQLICDDAARKGWTPPPETSKAIHKLLSTSEGRYQDAFYHSENHRFGLVAKDLLHGTNESYFHDTDWPGATCWVIKPLLRIDYVLMCSTTAKTCQVRQHHRLKSDASDHFPVMVDITFQADVADVN